MSKVNLVPVNSSMIQAIGYSASTKGLTVVFHSGESYAYIGVPADLYANFMGAKSHGQFFNQHIRNKFGYANVAGARA